MEIHLFSHNSRIAGCDLSGWPPRMTTQPPLQLVVVMTTVWLIGVEVNGQFQDCVLKDVLIFPVASALHRHVVVVLNLPGSDSWGSHLRGGEDKIIERAWTLRQPPKGNCHTSYGWPLSTPGRIKPYVFTAYLTFLSNALNLSLINTQGNWCELNFLMLNHLHCSDKPS